jgi:hypothetical protein
MITQIGMFIHGGLEHFKSNVYVPAGDLLKKYKHIRQNLLVKKYWLTHQIPFNISVRKLLFHNSLNGVYQKTSDLQAMKCIHARLKNFKSDVYVPAGDLLKKYKHIR